MTALVENDPSGFSVLVVVWFRNTSTTADSGCSSATAALTIAALVLTDFLVAAGALHGQPDVHLPDIVKRESIVEQP